MSKKDEAKKFGVDTTDTTEYGNNTSPNKQNGTVTRDALRDKAKELGIKIEDTDKKPIIGKKICEELDIPFKESEYIGKNGQVSKLFLKDVNDAQKK